MLRPGKLGVDGQSAASSEPVHWIKGELIGAGAFGRVYMGLNNETGQLMAVKQASSPAGNISLHTCSCVPCSSLVSACTHWHLIPA